VLEGEWFITADQSYANGVIIGVAGELVFGEDDAFGSIGGNIVNEGLLAINRSDLYTVTAAISGAGAFEQRGSGVTFINQANTFEGGTLLTAGTLRLSAVGAVGTGEVTFGDDTQFLQIDNTALVDNAFANTIQSLGYGDAIDFSGLSPARSASTRRRA